MPDSTGNPTHQDFTRQDSASAEPEAPMFASTPIYARTTGKKRRGFGAGSSAAAAAAPAAVPVETRSFAEPTPSMRVEPAATTAANTDTGFGMAGARRTTPAKRTSKGAPMSAVAAGAVALVALAGAGLYAMNSGDEPATTTAATGPALPPMATTAPPTPGPMAAATPMTPATPAAATPAAPTPAAAPTPQVRETTRTTRVARSTARARPAAASAASESADASATVALPAGPQPYTSVASSPAIAPPALAVPPVTPAPDAAPAVTPDAPAPQTPPSEATTTTDPTATP